MYIIHIAGMVLCVGKEFYVIQILESFYVEIIIFPVIFDGQTPSGSYADAKRASEDETYREQLYKEFKI